MVQKQTWQELLNGYFVSEPDQYGERKGFCPFHSDENPSAYYNIEKQVMDCKACEAAGDFRQIAEYIRLGHNPFGGDEIYHANPIHFEKASRRERNHSFDQDTLTPDLVRGYHFSLMMEEEHASKLEWLYHTKGLSPETITDREIGVEFMPHPDKPGMPSSFWRYTIPVFPAEIPTDFEDRTVLNVRRYSALTSTDNKIINFPGHGEARIYPMDVLTRSDEVIICEGEWDALVTNQNGFTAVTGTAGAGAWRPEWSELFRDKTVYIAYDNDEEGDQGSQMVARALFGIAAAIHIVQVPGGHKADVGNLWVDQGWSKEQFQELLDSAVPFTPQVHEEITEQERDALPLYHSVSDSFQHLSDGDFVLEADVMWTDNRRHSIIQSATLTCEGATRPACEDCGFKNIYGRRVEHVTNPNDDWVTSVILDGDGKQKQEISRQYDVYFGKSREDKPCKFLRFEDVNNTWSRTMIAVDPPSPAQSNAETIKMHLVSDRSKDITEGKRYKFTGNFRRDNKSQAFLVSTDFLQAQVDIDSFDVTPAFKGRLDEYFKQREDETVLEAANRVAFQLSYDTQIFGRNDIHLAILMAMMSPLSMRNDMTHIKRGWLDVLIFGDTRTGKTETATRLIEHAGLGTMSSAESATFAGLIGGVHSIGAGTNAINWGLFPRNDRRMIIMDELSKLTQSNTNLLSMLTAPRSEGVARVDKIVSGARSARVRKVWLSNSVGSTADHYGINGVEPLVGNPEDVARFDYALYVVQEDAEPTDQIMGYVPEGEGIPPHVFRSMVLWAWTRMEDDIEVAEAIPAAFAAQEKLNAKYSGGPSLLGTSDVWMKLLRMAASLAILTGSTKDCQKIFVEERHVDAAVEWLEMIYSRQSFGFRGLIQERERRIKRCVDMAHDIRPVLEAVPEIIKATLDGGAHPDLITHAGKRHTFYEHMGETHNGPAIELLVQAGFVTRIRGQGWVATPGLQEVVRRQREGTL